MNAEVPPVPQYLNWSEDAITRDRSDHPRVMPNPGGYTLVLEPMFISPKRACTFSRLLIDGGSNINILYRDTLGKLGIAESSLMPSRTVFHDIVPGHAGSSMGLIRPDVLFRTKDNHRRESVLFEVVDHTSAYHAILGRQALAKFMAVPHTPSSK